MKSDLIGAGLLAVILLITTAAAAPILQDEPEHFPTPEEALRNMPEPVPKRCFDEAGTNICIALPLMIGDPPGQLWAGVWRTTDYPLECIDRRSGDLAECDAPGAVRTLASPSLCVRNPDGSQGQCTRLTGGWSVVE